MSTLEILMPIDSSNVWGVTRVHIRAEPIQPPGQQGWPHPTPFDHARNPTWGRSTIVGAYIAPGGDW